MLNLVMDALIFGYLMFTFGKYAWYNPDEADCWVGALPGSGTRVVATAVTNPETGITLNNAVNVSEQFVLWFEMGFYYYLVNLVLVIIASVGMLIKSPEMANIGKGLCGCSCIFFLVWMIMGSIFRWGADGTLASCFWLKCKDPLTGQVLFNDKEEALGTGYQYNRGRWMNYFIIIMYVPLTCLVFCVPILVCKALSSRVK